EHVHERVTAQVAKAQVAHGIAEELLVLCVAVIAEAKLHGVLARCVGDVNLGHVVLGRVVPVSRSHTLCYEVWCSPATANSRYIGVAVVEEGVETPSRGFAGIC